MSMVTKGLLRDHIRRHGAMILPAAAGAIVYPERQNCIQDRGSSLEHCLLLAKCLVIGSQGSASSSGVDFFE